jgi:hypothetical protein
MVPITSAAVVSAPGIGSKQDRGIMAAAGSHDVDGHASIEEQGFVCAAEIMEP